MHAYVTGHVSKKTLMKLLNTKSFSHTFSYLKKPYRLLKNSVSNQVYWEMCLKEGFLDGVLR